MYVKPEFNNIYLNLTDACNLRCKYCFVEKNPHYMTYQIAQDATDMLIDIFRSHPERKDAPNVNFFGGEPTLMWDEIIVPLVEHYTSTGQLGKEIQFSMTTNAILLDDAKMSFLEKHNISILFSIDGMKETQDYNRPHVNPGVSSFDILEPKIADIAHRFKVTFRGTLLPETCHHLFENIMFASKFEFVNCFFIPDWSNNNWTEANKKILEQEVHKYSLYFIDCYRRGVVPFDLASYTRQFKVIYKLIKYQKRRVREKRFLLLWARSYWWRCWLGWQYLCLC